MTATLALTASLLVAPHSAYAEATPLPPVDRSVVVTLWSSGGTLVRPAAQAALLGTDDDVRAFLTQLDDLQSVDNRIAVNQVAAAGGPSVRQAAERALDSGEVAGFLASGWQDAIHADQRIRVNQLIVAGGDNVRKAGEAALDADTKSPPDPGQTSELPDGPLDEFVGGGFQDYYEVDQRIRINQIAAAAPDGSNVRRMAEQALDDGSLDTFDEFLDSGWAVAAAWDQESSTISDLTATAERASDEAAQQNATAKDQAAKASTASAAAESSAAAALKSMNDAKNDTKKAQTAAAQAVSAAQSASEAAKQALSASDAAVTAARDSARAAARAAAVAALTRKAANAANKAAAQAAVNKNAAKDAKDLAKLASDAALKAKDAATALTETITAAIDAENTAAAANAASASAARAEADSTLALSLAKQAGVDVAAAQNAARRAHDQAARANRAATAAASFARVAHNAAIAARDAASAAADDAIAAAKHATDAAAHAGDATKAAQASTEAADAASTAADAAVAAANQAYAVYDAARSVDASRLAIAAEADQDQAKDALGSYQEYQKKANWDAQESAKRDAETNRLIAEVRNPATAAALAVADSRQVAFTLAQVGGPNTRQLALEALGGSDDYVVGFVQSAIDEAAAQDDRESVTELMMTGTTARYTAAQAALASTDVDVRVFLENQDYPQRSTEDRVTVNQVVAKAEDEGRSTVVQQGDRALDSGDAAIREFLTTGQFVAAETDDRIMANRIMATSTPNSELWYGARNALDGPPGALHQFLVTGQYIAARDTADADAHDQEMLALLKRASDAATTAVQNAQEAQSVAADARGDATSAANWTAKAAASATAAAGYASEAFTAAQKAERSAQSAALSAATAAQAAKVADKAAEIATRNAAAAQVSYRQAQDAAGEAAAAAKRAHDDALAAGKSKREALAARDAAYDEYVRQATNEAADARHDLFAQCLNDAGPFDSLQKNCYEVYQDPGIQAARATLNRTLCEKYADIDQQYYSNCIADTMNPNFQFNRAFDVLDAMSTLMGETAIIDGIAGAMVILGVFCLEVCSLAGAVAAGPEAFMGIGGLFDLYAESTLLRFVGGAAGATISLPAALRGILGSVRLPAIFERVAVSSKILDSDFAGLMAKAVKTCSTGVPNSFAAGTPVVLEGGGTKPIEEIQPGDRVVTTDVTTGITESEPVQALITGSGVKDLIDITVAGSDSGTVTATANHPFWVPDLKEWRNAGDLQVGQWLQTASGTWVQVAVLDRRTETTTVYNLSITTQPHTFYVHAGAATLLVHNEEVCNVALGYRYMGLESWAHANGYTHYLRSATWASDVAKAISKPNTIIRVSTKGFGVPNGWTGDPTLGRFVNMIMIYTREMKAMGTIKATPKEMFWLLEETYWTARPGTHTKLPGRPNFANVHFYDDYGLEVSLPDDLDLWNLIRDFGKSDPKWKELERKFQRMLDSAREEKENP